LSVRAAHLGALALVLASGTVLLLHGASTKTVPGVALPAATAPKTQTAAAPKPAGQAKTKAPAGSAAKPTHGPLLSTTQIAPFTYQIYPTQAAQLSQAEAGFQIAIHQVSPSERKVVISNQLGGGTALQQNFLASDHAYWIETSYGDDAPGQDANLGDDGFVLTDAHGYITQK
jgi:hypothetical protein